MKLALLGMHRSGTNVIGRWLLRQSGFGNGNLHSYNETDWILNGTILRDEWKTYWFFSQVNHPEHKYSKVDDNHVVTIEREGMRHFAEFCHLNDYTWNGACFVLRDFRNWLASAYKMNGGKIIPDNDIIKYESHLREAINIANGGSQWCVPIIYNLWCKSKIYRSHIALKLCKQFTDDGYKDVPPNGGGSSFSGTWYDGAGHMMKTEKRYKEFDSDPIFQRMIKQYSDLVRLSDEWIIKV